MPGTSKMSFTAAAQGYTIAKTNTMSVIGGAGEKVGDGSMGNSGGVTTSAGSYGGKKS